MDSLSVPPLEMINHYSSKHNLQQDEDALFTNQILDIIFTSRPNEKLGFGVRIDESRQCLQINSINFEGDARRVGLKQGDIILAVNDVDVDHNPKIGIEELQKCKAISTEEEIAIRITVCRRVFDHILVTISRSGISKCDGKYHFIHLDDDYDSPIFMNQDNGMLLLKANYDLDTGESLWSISDQENNYYIGVSSDLMPPNDSWEPIKSVAKYPSPGLVFFNTEQGLIEIEDEDEQSSDDDDDFININYENSPAQKRMSRIGQNALKNPSSIIHPAAVYEHMNEYDEESGYASLQSQDSDDSNTANTNEWETKYNQLSTKYDESQETIKILRQNVKELNASFYQFWLRNKTKQEENDQIKRTLSQQSKLLFEQNKVEMKFIDKLNNKQTVSGRKKVDSLCDIDLDSLFAPDDTIIHLEIEEFVNEICVESETEANQVNELQQEITGLNERISVLYDAHLDLLFDENEQDAVEDVVVDKLYEQIKELEEENKKVIELKEEVHLLKEENMEMYLLHHEVHQLKQQQVEDLKKEIEDLRTKYVKTHKLNEEMRELKGNYTKLSEQNNRKHARNHELEKEVSELKQENNAIIASKLQLIHKTADEILKLKNIIHGMSRYKN